MSSKVVFLMRELSGYFVFCIQQWKRQSNEKICVVFWPTNQDAPFQWSMEQDIEWIEKKEFLSRNNHQEFWSNVKHLFVAGWADQQYNSIVKGQNGISKTILFDTQWNASTRMRLGRFLLYFKIIRYFNFAWVPGIRQARLAQKLFFKSNEIFENFYIGDQFLFDHSRICRDSENGTLNIVYAGRLIPEKGILPFIHQFIATTQSGNEKNWHLHICGIGPLLEHCPFHANITYHGFMQPNELASLFKRMDVFILPSVYEPWGVVVHEAAFSGLALIVSDAVGAADQFVESNLNGWVVPSGDSMAIISCIHQYSQFSAKEKGEFSLHSQSLARSIDSNTWVKRIHQILNEAKCVG